MRQDGIYGTSGQARLIRKSRIGRHLERPSASHTAACESHDSTKSLFSVNRRSHSPLIRAACGPALLLVLRPAVSAVVRVTPRP